MKIPALIACVASAMSVGWAGAAERFRPAAPDYVVMHVPARAAHDPIASLEQRYAQAPDAGTAAALAALYVERARSQREARYFGRAEMLLQPWLAKPDVSAATLRVQADILQNRHDFAGALRLLDDAIARDPRDAGARLMRASVKVVQGHAVDARADCAAVLASGESAAGTVCFAQVLGSTGHLAQAEALLNTLLTRIASSGAARAPSASPLGISADVLGWALWLSADFADRRGDAHAAEAQLREAMKATPTNEGVRSALADLLIARGAFREALAVVDLPAPSTGLLARRARAQQLLRDPGLSATRAQLDDVVTLARRRGEIPHLREEALVALDVDGDAARALQLATQNFATQRETIDARLLVRAARAQGDREAFELVTRWMRATGFEDKAITEIRS
ncbi:MAG TPA: tetratricopeptide repeat protein [Steroidobacteraceae bacterium]|nr:tetratricopeptide repeat protein [Steroidobacteraceae bacterium]